MKHILYEQHLVSPEMGFLHVVSEELVSDKILQNLIFAAETLFHQYEIDSGTDICIQHLNNFDETIQSKLVLEETYKNVYLVNPMNLVNFFDSYPEYSNEVYLMSDTLNNHFHKLLREKEEGQFSKLLIDVFKNHGLIYAIIL